MERNVQYFFLPSILSTMYKSRQCYKSYVLWIHNIDAICISSAKRTSNIIRVFWSILWLPSPYL